MQKNHHPYIGHVQIILADGSSYLEPSILVNQRCEYNFEKDKSNHTLWYKEDYEVSLDGDKTTTNLISMNARRARFNKKFRS